jgi:hypothetical protein
MGRLFTFAVAREAGTLWHCRVGTVLVQDGIRRRILHSIAL